MAMRGRHLWENWRRRWGSRRGRVGRDLVCRVSEYYVYESRRLCYPVISRVVILRMWRGDALCP